MSAFIHIQANGQTLPGQAAISSVAGIDLAQHTQIYSLFFDASTASGRTASGSSGTAARPETSPLSFLKTQDGISPWLLQALFQNHSVIARIRFFDLDLETGEPRLNHEITMSNARITSVRRELQQPLSNGDESATMERISIMPANLIDRSLLSSHEFSLSLTDIV